MADERRDDAIDAPDKLEALRAEVRGMAVSPAFAVRVRQRIEIEGDRRGWRTALSSWRSALAVTSSIGAVWLAILLAGRLADREVFVQAPIPAPTARVVPSPPTVASSAEAGDIAAGPPVHRSGPPRIAAPPPAGAPASPDVQPFEVITDQPAVLRAMWARTTSPTSAIAPESAAVILDVPEIVIPPIEVNPVSVLWRGEMPPMPQAAPSIRKASTEAAERSAQ